jgi:hypothetical protein
MTNHEALSRFLTCASPEWQDMPVPYDHASPEMLMWEWSQGIQADRILEFLCMDPDAEYDAVWPAKDENTS